MFKKNRYYIFKFLIYVFVIDITEKSYKIYNKKKFILNYDINSDFIILTEKV